ncbi:hypothetical protein [Streptomyces tanashiensis]|uniref:hypothetical protein n=1 Tax=Streptomyces tanashiensis TaxID=67367 RepID=UPI0034495034
MNLIEGRHADAHAPLSRAAGTYSPQAPATSFPQDRAPDLPPDHTQAILEATQEIAGS